MRGVLGWLGETFLATRTRKAISQLERVVEESDLHINANEAVVRRISEGKRAVYGTMILSYVPIDAGLLAIGLEIGSPGVLALYAAYSFCIKAVLNTSKIHSVASTARRIIHVTRGCYGTPEKAIEMAQKISERSELARVRQNCTLAY